MIRWSTAAYILGGAMIVGAFSQQARPPQTPTPEQYVSDPGSVGFDIQPVQGGGGASHWLATYPARGKTAKFIIELGPERAGDDKQSKEFDIAFGEGRLVSEPGSDATALLSDLQKALQAKRVPMNAQRVSALPFTFVRFGKNKSEGSDGGFNSTPPGNWTPMKIFLRKGRKEGQVFLNLNPVIMKGQFSIKDSDYGDLVLAQLAKVL